MRTGSQHQFKRQCKQNDEFKHDNEFKYVNADDIEHEFDGLKLDELEFDGFKLDELEFDGLKLDELEFDELEFDELEHEIKFVNDEFK